MTGGLSWDGGRLEGTSFQGIRFLSIEFPQSGAMAVLTVHLNQPVAGLTPDAIRVTGDVGARLPRYGVQLAGSTAVIAFEDFGSQSSYRVELIPGPGSPVSVHPFFAAAEFQFTIDCETGDCREIAPVASRPTNPPPAVDLLTKDYTGFVGLLADWVKVHEPNMADLSPASLERVLLDLLAWSGDMLSYYQDRVANEAFIETATQRFSLRQHAVLLGTRLDDGRAPDTVLAFDVAVSGYIPAGLEVRMRTTSDEVPVVFEVVRRTRVRPQNNASRLAVAAWPGATDAEIPAATTELLLWGHDVQLDRGERIAFVQGPFAQVVTLSRDPRRLEQAGWVESPAQSYDPATDPPAKVTRLEFAEPLRQTIRPWSVPNLTLHANLADAAYGTRRTAMVRAAPDPRDRRQVAVVLDRRTSIVERSRTGGGNLLRALRVPEPAVVHEDDGPALEVLVDQEPWVRVEHLHRSRSYDLHYAAESDEEGAVWVRFGDGIHGHEVPVQMGAAWLADVELRYRVGDPVLGNVGVGTLTEVAPPATAAIGSALADVNVLTVANVLPGSDGRAPQSLGRAREDIPASLRHGALQRAVAAQDYAAAAMEVPRVGRATARAAGGLFNTVIVLVDPEGAEVLDDVLRREVHERLDALRMAGREHVVAAATYVPIEVELLLCAEAGFAPHRVRERVLAELEPGSRERPGWFHPDRLSFGDEVRLGDLLAFVQGVAGVRTIKATAFHRRDDRSVPLVHAIISLGLTEVARLDADPDAPENGTLEVRVVGLDGDPKAFTVDPVAVGGSGS